MTFRQLLEGLVAAGGTLALHNGRVRLTAPSGRLSEALLRDLRAKEDEVRRFLEARQGDLSGRIGLGSCQRPRNLPLSYAQQRLWFVDRLERGTSTQYNVLAGHRLRGPLDRGALERAINMIVERHESLRTHFEETGGGPVQVIEPVLRIPLAVEDLSELGEAEQQKRIADAMRLERKRAFDLASGPLLRTKLLKVGEQEHILLRAMHHIVSDGWSQAVLNRELLVLYEAYREGRGNPLKPLPVQYADFALWQRERLEGGALEEGLAYWKNQLEGMPERLELPTDRPRPAVQTFEAEVCETSLSAELSEALRRLSRENQATQYMTLLAAFAVLLSRYSGQDDIVVGSPIANRQEQQLEDLIGFFVNMLVMRVRVKGDKSFRELLHDVRKTALEAYQHQDVPFERLVEELAPERNLNESPVFQVSFALQNAPSVPKMLKGLKLRRLALDTPQVRFDLEVYANHAGRVMNIAWLYNRDLFDRWRIEQMARHYAQVIEAIATDQDATVRKVRLFTDAERTSLLTEFGQSDCHVPKVAVTELFEQQVEMSPHSIAVRINDISVTYRELNDQADRLANYLKRKGVGTGDLVGVAVPRSVEVVVAILAVLKAGAAYLPLDTGYPKRRLQYLLKDSRGALVVTVSRLKECWAKSSVRFVMIDEEAEQIAAISNRGLDRTYELNDLAYVIYTSGSTGKPKGVMIPHGALANYVCWAIRAYEVGPGIVSPVLSSLAFDLTVTSLLVPLAGGATVELITEGQELGALASATIDGRYALVKLTPTHLRAVREILGEAQPPGGMWVVGGEALRWDHLEDWSDIRAINEYGPTEATVGCCVYEARPDTNEEGDVPIGRPISNTYAYVLDPRLEPVPMGVTGELYIAGAGLARGYLGRAGLTAERFVADPYRQSASRMYRTGDLVRWRGDKELEFVGRADAQVKIRGFRVELGEVETLLRSNERVQDAVVIAQHGCRPGESRLVGYVIPKENREQGREAQASLIRDWQQTYEATYKEAHRSGDFIGWISSYTGEPIPIEQMREWMEETIQKIRLLMPRRVLEIGCGTGLLLTRLAADCTTYIGLDFSNHVLDQLKRYLSTRTDLRHVQVRHGLADDLSFANDHSVDMVILNSVVQYFPSVAYLLRVLKEAVRVTDCEGHIFVGDVRNLRLHEAFHLSVQLHRVSQDMSLGELRQRIRSWQSKDHELLIDPKLFEELGKRWEQIGRVETWQKVGGYDNELSRFRYDVAIRIGKKVTIATPDWWIKWDAHGRWKNTLKGILHTHPTSAVRIQRIRDSRVVGAIRALRLLQDREGGIKNVGALCVRCATAVGEHPAVLIEFATAMGVNFSSKSIREDGTYDVIFNPRWQDIQGESEIATSFYQQYGNTPLECSSSHELGRLLQGDLRRVLPGYMVPSAVMMIDAWPLMPNGKLNRKALPVPEFISTKEFCVPQTPAQEILCGLFAEVLGLECVGLDDNFFELGGHSLMATRLVMRIRTTLGSEVAIRALFESPSPRQLSLQLPGQDKMQTALERKERPVYLPLSYAQQRLWFVDRLERGTSTQYNVLAGHRLRGPLDRGALERAINMIVERHESLRTHFEETGGGPVQVIEPVLRIPLAVEDLSELGEAEQQKRIADAMRLERKRAFDLASGPLLRTKLLKVGEQEHILLRAMHHIVSDGWSQAVLNRELLVLYEAYREGRGNPLKPLPVQYADFALWQRERLEGGALEEGLAYWKNQLEGMPERLELPTDRPRPAVQTFEAEVCETSLSAELSEALRRLSRENQATQYMTLLAAFAVLLSRYSGQDDIVVGSPIANRQEQQLEDLIGFFVNVLVMRVRVKGDKSFRELLHDVRKTALEAYQHQDVPFERLVEELAPERNLNSTPIHQVMLAVQNMPTVAHGLKGVEMERVKAKGIQARFDLELNVWESGASTALTCLYNRDLFDRWRIEQMVRHYVRILEEITADSEQDVGSIDLLSDEERRRMLEEYNDTGREASRATLPELFEAQVERTPEAIAVVYQDRRLTYSELNRRANQLAHLLIGKGIGPEDTVALALSRSTEMIVGLLGILKAGAAYLPLDPNYPQNRLAFMVQDTKPTCMLTDSHILPRVPTIASHILLDDPHISETLARLAKTNPSDRERHTPLTPQNAFYVIYTSGSTGAPKGVVCSYSGLLSLVKTQVERLNVGIGTKVLQFASGGVDASLWETLIALTAGGTLVVIEDALRNSPQLENAIVANGITHALLPPSLLQTLQPSSLGPLGTLIVGGEACSSDLVQAWSHERCLINAYGPTESTICATISKPIASLGNPPLGPPVANTLLYVLNPVLEPVPIGVNGELYIAGDGLARGYFNRAGLTAERFVANPFAGMGRRIYRTGDLVRWRKEGILEFVGRTDHQVKVRGFRVELGEVETALRGHERVHDAVVVSHEDRLGKEKLVGYVILKEIEGADSEAEMSVIREWQQIYESTYQEAQSCDDFNLVGWNSSYTEEPIPPEEMRNWVNETVERLRVLRPKRVIEIGCGTGLLLTRLAGSCEKYVGLDFSRRGLDQLQEYMSTRSDLSHVELRHGLAENLSFASDSSVDVVILNSVVQYFPSVAYLLKVLREAVRVAGHEGAIFVGDVRNLRLHEAFHSSVELHKAPKALPIEELKSRIRSAQLQDPELLVDPELFKEIAKHWAKVGRVDTWLKMGDYDNELSRFRYDIVIRIGKKVTQALPERWVSWDKDGQWRDELKAAICARPRLTVGLQCIRDGRVASAMEAVRRLRRATAGGQNAGQLRAHCVTAVGEHPASILQLATKMGVTCSWQSIRGDGGYDVIFDVRQREIESEDEVPSESYRRYANTPSRSWNVRDVGPTLQKHLRNVLPDYMVPATIMTMEAWPLMQNGKLDRRALPAPQTPRVASSVDSMSEKESILCAVFADVLDVGAVGPQDNFFALGGHSLMAVRLVARLSTAFGIELTVDLIFEAPTIRELAERLDDPVSANAYRRVLSLRSRGTMAPLVCFPPAGGIGWVYAGLTGTIHSQRPIHCLQAPSIVDNDPFPKSLTAVARDYLDVLRECQPSGPYNLLGWSFGGLVAHEAACLLQETGETISLLAILDTCPLSIGRKRWVEREVEELSNNSDIIRDRLSHYLDMARQHINGPWPSSLGVKELEQILKLQANVIQLMSSVSHYSTFDGDVLLFSAKEGPYQRSAWSKYVTGDIELHELDCRHVEVTTSGPIERIGRVIEERLSGATAASARQPASGDSDSGVFGSGELSY